MQCIGTVLSYLLTKISMHTAAKSELESLSIHDDRLDTFLRSRMTVMYPKAWSVGLRSIRPMVDPPRVDPLHIPVDAPHVAG